MINANLIYLIFTTFVAFTEVKVKSPICGGDMTDIIKTMKIAEGENIVCTSVNGKKYIAIVRNNKIVDWKITDNQGVTIKTLIDRSLISSKAKPKPKPKPHSDVLPEKVTVCEEVNGKPANCITYTRVL